MKRFSIVRQVLKDETAVYSITNKITGRKYYGSTNDVYERFRAHRERLRKGKHENKELQRDYNELGPRCFGYTVEDILGSREQAERIERRMIREDPGSYNVKRGADPLFIDNVAALYETGGYTFRQLAKMSGVPLATLYRHTQKHEINN